jgi:hypothetical protein
VYSNNIATECSRSADIVRLLDRHPDWTGAGLVGGRLMKLLRTALHLSYPCRSSDFCTASARSRIAKLCQLGTLRLIGPGIFRPLSESIGKIERGDFAIKKKFSVEQMVGGIEAGRGGSAGGGADPQGGISE